MKTRNLNISIAAAVLTVAGIGRAHATSATARATQTERGDPATSPAEATAKKYPNETPCPAGGYQLCIDGGSNFVITGKHFSGTPNAILLLNVSNVKVIGNTFTDLKGTTSYAAVHIKYSKGVVVKKNQFERLISTKPDMPGEMHGVYVVRSSGVTITGNTFSEISGDAIRLRDGVTNTKVSGNTIKKSGRYAIVSEWGKIDAKKSKKESCGHDNVVKDNHYSVKGYSGKKIALIEWGGWGGGKKPANPKHKTVTFGHCPSPSIKDGGNNKPI